MGSRVIDLTLDSSPIPVRQNPASNMPRAASRVPPALTRAVDTVDVETLRKAINDFLPENPLLVEQLSNLWLVLGKDVVRYHVDTEDEDAAATEESEKEEEDSDSKDEKVARIRNLQPIGLSDDSMTPRYAKCENCKEEFDVTSNERGDCVWHTGIKLVDYESDLWDDHDENCHGRCEDFDDDEDYAEGFQWNCCERAGDNEGCKVTKHKAPVNRIVGPNSRKRKTEGGLGEPRKRSGRQR